MDLPKLVDFPGGYGSPNQAIQLLEACAEKLALDKSDSSCMFHAALSVFETYGRQHLLYKWDDARTTMIRDEVVDLDTPIRAFLICTEQKHFESGWVLFASLEAVSQYTNRFIKHAIHTKSPVYVAATINMHGGAAVLRLGRVARKNQIKDDSVVVGPMLRASLGLVQAINTGRASVRMGNPIKGGVTPNLVSLDPSDLEVLDKPRIIC